MYDRVHPSAHRALPSPNTTMNLNALLYRGVHVHRVLIDCLRFVHDGMGDVSSYFISRSLVYICGLHESEILITADQMAFLSICFFLFLLLLCIAPTEARPFEHMCQSQMVLPHCEFSLYIQYSHSSYIPFNVLCVFVGGCTEAAM